MKHFIKKISITLIIVLLLQISLFGQAGMLKQVEASAVGCTILINNGVLYTNSRIVTLIFYGRS